ncbi:MAG: hypothetical protein JXQ73_06960 [Phycisphaerae bacterium]|nr:hypothetical protein [Phycisphaerae bacterium]
MKCPGRDPAISISLAIVLAVAHVGALAQAPAGLVVVAPERFGGALSGYVRHKQRQLPVDVLVLEKALEGAPGVDAPERLKRRIYEGWENRGWRYVLLVGDADVLPVRYMVLDRITPAAADYAFYPSDLYYADLAKRDGSFEDWNGRKDGFHAGYFGEVRGEKNKNDPINFDAVDYLPEVAVGRWPVSTTRQVEIVAAKTIRYEERLRNAGRLVARRAGFVAVGGWVDSRQLFDRLAGALPPGWIAEKLYFADKRNDPATPPPTAEEVVRLMNEGLDLLIHAGHGKDDRWERSLGLVDLVRIRNANRLPVIVSAGCSTARFAALPPYEPYLDIDGEKHKGTNHGEVFSEPPPPPAPYQTGRYNRTGLGEGLLRIGPSGAVAYIGCNTGSQPCGLTLVEGFVKGLQGLREPRLGDVWNRAIRHYFKKEKLATLEPKPGWYPPSIFFQGMKFMVFGDPSLQLPPPASTDAGPTSTRTALPAAR